jgi:membrane protease YdiL (CAAX protease family)
LANVIRWGGRAPRFGAATGLALGTGAGVVLTGLAASYMTLLQFFPWARESIEEASRIASSYEGQRFWIFLLAVGFAPVAEEHFFRVLLFRTLDRELGDWRRIVLSAAFFAIFHPPLAWVPVGCLGLCTAWLFHHTRHLLPCGWPGSGNKSGNGSFLPPGPRREAGLGYCPVYLQHQCPFCALSASMASSSCTPHDR